MKSLGKTKAEIYKNWQSAEGFGRYIVIGSVSLLGKFSWKDGNLIKHERTARGVATWRPASQSELNQIDEAIERGWLQIERRPAEGITMTKASQDQSSSKYLPIYILHQATGQRLDYDGEA